VPIILRNQVPVHTDLCIWSSSGYVGVYQPTSTLKRAGYFAYMYLFFWIPATNPRSCFMLRCYYLRSAVLHRLGLEGTRCFATNRLSPETGIIKIANNNPELIFVTNQSTRAKRDVHFNVPVTFLVTDAGILLSFSGRGGDMFCAMTGFQRRVRIDGPVSVSSLRCTYMFHLYLDGPNRHHAGDQ
jgi:hypothetical protein